MTRRVATSRVRVPSLAVVISVAVHAILLFGLARLTILSPVRTARLAESAGATIQLEAQPPAPERHAPAATAEAVVPKAPPEPQPTPAPVPTPPRAEALLITAQPVRVPETAAMHPTMKPSAAAPAPASTPPPPKPQDPSPPRASFAGMEVAPASRIVYVVDGSAAMVTSLPYVREELIESVARLGSTQEFQVVVFRHPPVVADAPAAPEIESFAPAGAYERATPAAKARLVEWIGMVRPRGGSAPLVGLRAGLGQSPDLIFLLTCSIKRTASVEWGEGRDTILATLDRLNPVNAWTHQRATVIKAVQFLDDDPTGILPAIADAHGDGPGSYRVLRLRDMAR